MRLLTILITLGTLASGQTNAAPVVEKRDWTQSFEVSTQPALSIDNIWGDITVTAGSSNKIEVSLESVRRADNQEYFDRSLELIPLEIGQNGDEVFIHVGRQQQNWRRSPRCNGCRLHLDLVVRVPRNTTLDVRTVNDGNVIVSGVSGRVTATNVNGSVSTRGLTLCDEVETINGDVDVEFAANPGADCRIETLNGDIELSLAQDANVNFAVSLQNGKMRSGLDLQPRATTASIEHTKRGGRHHYDIEQLAGLRLGRGGHLLTLKSFNGDVLIAKGQ